MNDLPDWVKFPLAAFSSVFFALWYRQKRDVKLSHGQLLIVVGMSSSVAMLVVDGLVDIESVGWKSLAAGIITAAILEVAPVIIIELVHFAPAAIKAKLGVKE